MAQEKSREEKIAELRSVRDKTLAEVPPRNGGDKNGTSLYLVSGQLTGLGQPSERFSLSGIQQMVAGFLEQGWDHRNARNDMPRTTTNIPSWGKTPVSEERSPRVYTEFYFIPIPWTDKVVVWKIVDGKPKPLKAFHPEVMKTVPRDRRWCYLANYGPMHPIKSHPGRVQMRRQFPYFDVPQVYNYEHVKTPWKPTTEQHYRAMNPKLVRKSLAEIEEMIASGDVPEGFTQWRFANATEQSFIFHYAELMVLLGGMEDPRNVDPHNIQVDFDWNRRHDCPANPVRGMDLDPSGVPIYERISDKSPYFEPKMADGPTPVGRLINSNQEAQELNELNQGYGRIRFDPNPTHYYDLWGNRYDRRVPEYGIVSDVERLIEWMYSPSPSHVKQFVAAKKAEEVGDEKYKKYPWHKRAFSAISHRPKAFTGFFEAAKSYLAKLRQGEEALEELRPPEEKRQVGPPPLWIGAPTHSIVDLFVQLMGEGFVLMGKWERHRKLSSHQARLHSLGSVTYKDMESDTSAWWMTWVPRMALEGMADSEFFLPYYNFWYKATDPEKGFINRFAWSEMDFDEFRKLVVKSPQPTDFQELAALWVYFKFDPIDSIWGYEPDGTPRLPARLLRRLVLDPTQGGVNMIAPKGQRMLENYRQVIGDGAVRAFWHMSEEAYNQALANGQGDYLTMGYVFWRPMEEVGNYYKGFLYELWRNQPVKPYDQRIEHRTMKAERNHIVNTLEIVVEEDEGMPDADHDRPDFEEATARWRRRATYWMQRRMFELHNIGAARAFRHLGEWYGKYGFPARIGDPTESNRVMQNAGWMVWFGPAGDFMHGGAEYGDDVGMQWEDDLARLKSGYESRKLTYQAVNDEAPGDDSRTANFRRRELGWELHRFAGFSFAKKQESKGKKGETAKLAERIRRKEPWATIQADLAAMGKTARQIEAVRVIYETHSDRMVDLV